MKEIQEISIPVDERSNEEIFAKQGDEKTREIIVQLVMDSQPFKASVSDKAEYHFLKPDGKGGSLPATVNSDGTITIRPDPQVFAVEGKVLVDVTLVTAGGKLSSANFIINVQKKPMSEEGIKSDNVYIELTTSAAEAKKSAAEAKTAQTAAAQSAAEAKKAAEDAQQAAGNSKFKGSIGLGNTMRRSAVVKGKFVNISFGLDSDLDSEVSIFDIKENTEYTLNESEAISKLAYYIAWYKDDSLVSGVDLNPRTFAKWEEFISGTKQFKITTLKSPLTANKLYITTIFNGDISDLGTDKYLRNLSLTEGGKENWTPPNSMTSLDEYEITDLEARKSIENIKESTRLILKNNNLLARATTVYKAYINGSFTISRDLNSAIALVPITGGASYVLNKSNCIKKGAFFVGWFKDGEPLNLGENLQKVEWRIDFSLGNNLIYKITSPLEANQLAVTVKFARKAEDNLNTMSVYEGELTNWKEPGEISAVNDSKNKLTYTIADLSGREKLKELVNKVNPNANRALLTFGDSLTDPLYSKYVPALRDKVGCIVKSYGSSGSTTKNLVNIVTGGEVIRTPTDSGNHTVIDYASYDTATIMIGTNQPVGSSTIKDIPIISNDTVATIANGGSISYEGRTISTFKDYWDLFPNTYYGNVALCIEWILWKNPAMKIYLLAPPPSTKLGFGYENEAEKLRTALLEIGRYYSVEVLDVLREAGISVHNVKIYTDDNTHFNELGGKKVADYLARKIFNV